MKIYLAGPSKEVQRVIEARDALIAAGHTCTSRWIDIILREHAGGKSDVDVSDATLIESAEINIHDLVEADMVVYMPPRNDAKSEGSAFEQGYAMARGRERIVVYAERYLNAATAVCAPRGNLFALLLPRFESMATLLAYLAGWE